MDKIKPNVSGTMVSEIDLLPKEFGSPESEISNNQLGKPRLSVTKQNFESRFFLSNHSRPNKSISDKHQLKNQNENHLLLTRLTRKMRDKKSSAGPTSFQNEKLYEDTKFHGKSSSWLKINQNLEQEKQNFEEILSKGGNAFDKKRFVELLTNRKRKILNKPESKEAF